MEPNDWAGNNPLYLVIEHTTNDVVERTGIDLDFPGWATLNEPILRKPGTWFLVSKQTNAPVLAIEVHEGEQAYYTARHVGAIGSGATLITGTSLSPQVTLYGLGKKHVDGTVERMWLFPNLMVVSGEEPERLASRLLRGDL